MSYHLIIDNRALQDVQEAIDFYDNHQTGLGKQFELILNKHFEVLQKSPFSQIRYDNIRCLPVKKFPYMIHFSVDEKDKKIIITAIFHTSINSQKSFDSEK